MNSTNSTYPIDDYLNDITYPSMVFLMFFICGCSSLICMCCYICNNKKTRIHNIPNSEIIEPVPIDETKQYFQQPPPPYPQQPYPQQPIMMQPVIMQPYHMNFDYNNHLKN
jgi:hypothetical protein